MLSAGVLPAFMLLLFSAVILALGLVGWALGVRKSLLVENKRSTLSRAGRTQRYENVQRGRLSGRPHLVAIPGDVKKTRTVKKPAHEGKPRSHADLGRKEFFLIINRLKDVAKNPWLNELKRGRAGRRLRLAILSWHEDLMSDVPLFDAKIGSQDFRGFFAQAHLSLSYIEDLVRRHVIDEVECEIAEQQVLKVLQYLTDISPTMHRNFS